jgi:hypothetical protein
MAEGVLFLRRVHDTENGLQPNNPRSTAAAWQNGTSNYLRLAERSVGQFVEAIRWMLIQCHPHPKRDQDGNGHNELGEEAVAHVRFVPSPSSTRRRIISVWRDPRAFREILQGL